MITIMEASKTLGVTAKTLRVWEKEGKIKSYRTDGGHRRYNLSDIEFLVAEKPISNTDKMIINQKIKKAETLFNEIREILNK